MHRLIGAALALAAILSISSCCPPHPGYRTSSGLEAGLATVQTVLAYPEMVTGSESDETYATGTGITVESETVPAASLPPDTFLAQQPVD